MTWFEVLIQGQHGTECLLFYPMSPDLALFALMTVQFILILMIKGEFARLF